MSEDQQEALDELRKFVDFVYAELGKVKNKSFTKKKKTVFLPMYVNACDIADSIHILLEKERVNTAQNLLRSLQETWINTQFIFIDGSQLWVDSYLYESEEGMKKFAKGARQIRKAYPDLDTAQKTFTDKRLAVIEARADRFATYIRKKYPTLPIIPHITTTDITKKNYTLRDRAAITDHFFAERAKPKTLAYSNEWHYLMIYKYLSGGTHIGASYLATNLVHKDKTVTTILKHGPRGNIQLCAWSALAFLWDISVVFSKQFGHPTSAALKPYKKVIYDLKEKIHD
jgi:hypothetical protein